MIQMLEDKQVQLLQLSEIVTNYGVKSRTIHFTTGSVGVHDNVI